MLHQTVTQTHDVIVRPCFTNSDRTKITTLQQSIA